MRYHQVGNPWPGKYQYLHVVKNIILEIPNGPYFENPWIEFIKALSLRRAHAILSGR